MPAGIGYSFDLGQNQGQPASAPQSVKLLNLRIPQPQPMAPMAQGGGMPMDQMIRGLMKTFQPQQPMQKRPMPGMGTPMPGMGAPKPLF